MKLRNFLRGTGAKDKGFTLVEVMIASGLMSFEILAVIAIFTTSMKANSFARHLTSASYLAQDLLDTAKNTPYVNLFTLAVSDECFNYDVGSVDCSYTPSPGDDVETIRNSNPVYTRSVDVNQNTPEPGVTEVEAEVSWNDDSGNTHSTTLITYISRY